MNADRDNTVVFPTKYDGILKIRQVAINPVFDHRNLVYRLEDHRYKKDFYNEYLIDPAEMFAEQIREWFTQSKLFPSVSFYRGSSNACFFMDVLVQEFYYDLRDKKAPKGVLSIIFRLDQRLGKKDLYYQQFQKVISVSDSKVPTLVSGQSQLLQQSLSLVEQELSEIPVAPCSQL